MGKSNSNVPTQVTQQAQTRYQDTTKPTATENEFVPFSQNLNNQATSAFEQNKQDYSNTMGAYGDFRNNLGGPTKFTAQTVSANRPAELGKAYGYLDEAMPGYRDFASTGGYSPTDIQELRARGTSPIRAAYGNTMANMDRARALGGSAGAPNYIAAASKAQRELPGQMADAETTVNANLADAVRRGKEFGLTGITGTGATMGGLSSQEAGRQLEASMANQRADLQAQGMGEQSLQDLRRNQLSSIGGQASLYGTTPGLSSMFGNQALASYGQRFGAENARNQFGLGLLDTQLKGYSAPPGQKPWWQTMLGAIGSVAPMFGNMIPGLGSGGGSPIGSANPSYAGSDQFGNNLPGYDTIGGYPGYLPGDPSGGTGIGPGMAGYYNSGGGNDGAEPVDYYGKP